MRSAMHSAPTRRSGDIGVLALIAMLAVWTSCDRATPTSKSTSQPASNTKPEAAVNQTWKYQVASVRARSPLTVTLRVSGAGPKAPFHWLVTVTDPTGSMLFRQEHDDRDIDQFFNDEGYISECKGYEACKDKWYFEELPKEVAGAVKIVDEPPRPVETWERDELVRQADEFLKGKGLSDKQRGDVIEEMLTLHTGHFDSLVLPENPVTEGNNFMYVPSLGYFVPYWHG